MKREIEGEITNTPGLLKRLQEIFSPEEAADMIGCMGFFIKQHGNSTDEERRSVSNRLSICIAKLIMGMPKAYQDESHTFLKQIGIHLETSFKTESAKNDAHPLH